MTKGNSKAIYWGEYFQKDGTYGNATIDNYPKQKVYNGPGGNYLSNEIFGSGSNVLMWPLKSLKILA